MKFRLNIGQHAGHSTQDPQRVRQWWQGQIIDTPTNLTKRFGTEKFTRVSDAERADEGKVLLVDQAVDLKELNKDDEFQSYVRTANEIGDHLAEQHLAEQTATGGVDPSFEATMSTMTLDELIKMAAEEEVDLGPGKKTKAQVITLIQQAQHSRATV